MKVFVAGATGVAGKRAVAQLVAARHDVTGLARSPEKADLVRSVGGTPVTVDLFDAAVVKGAVDGHEAVVNLTTHIPPTSRAALPGAWRENDRIRTEASANLVDAALNAGATRFVQESITLVYPDRGDQWIDEDTPLEVPSYARSLLDAEANARRLTNSGGNGVILRFAAFYAPDAQHTLDMIRGVRRRVAPALGANSYMSMIHADDVASATVAALAAPPGTYNVVDDEPMIRRQCFEILADALGVKPPRVPPRFLARLLGSKAAVLALSQRVSNRRFKDATGWAPRYASVREGWPAVVAAMPR